jgi:glycosyltransferase involved in cell wall biosynthesis
MKILAVSSTTISDSKQQSPVDMWRIDRPMRELAKHVDWTIDFVPGIIPKYAANKDLPEFTEAEMEEGLELVKQYDLVFMSYSPDPTLFTLLQYARNKFGVQTVLDVDDNMFAIHPGNPYWLKHNHDQVYIMQRMIAHADHVLTPSEHLAEQFRARKKEGVVHVIPNYISDAYQHPGFDNGDKLLIGFMGGSSHYFDLEDTGVVDAVTRVMHEHKEVHFQTIGMFTDKYVPTQRKHFDVGQRGSDYLTKLFPTLNFDIALAPLVDDEFNRGKSNIKWQEYTRAGSPVIASAVGPYKSLKDGVNALLVKDNTVDNWYSAIKQLVESEKLRRILVDNAQRDLKQHRLETHWTAYRDLFTKIMNERTTNADHRTGTGLSAGQASQKGHSNTVGVPTK